jgi:hypothetical protein
MPIHEQRQLFRIDDQIYFGYRVIKPNENSAKLDEEMLGKNGQKYFEAMQYFQEIDYEMSQLTQEIAIKEPTMAHFLNLMNAKIEYLSRSLLVESKLKLHKLNLSIGGLAFKSPEQIKENTSLRIVLYTRPKMAPVFLHASVVSCKFMDEHHYRVAVQFDNLSIEEENALSQHIMVAQIKHRNEEVAPLSKIKK